MIIGLIITGIIILIAGAVYEEENYNGVGSFVGGVGFLLASGIFIFGCFHGFINYPATEGTHQGTITAVDLEGIYFRRYEIYLKSSGYTNQSDETSYCVYDYEKDLIEELQNSIGKQVKLHYGHDGGYIGWKSCGTYHIKSVEIIEND